MAGLFFASHLDREEHLQQEPIQESIGRFFEMPVFVVFGMSLPWEGWQKVGFVGVFFIAAVLLLRRLPAWLLLRAALPSNRRLSDSLFSGWFGPIGIAALFYASRATRQTGNSLLWPTVSLAVFTSVIIHGFSAPLLTKYYGKKVSKTATGDHA